MKVNRRLLTAAAMGAGVALALALPAGAAVSLQSQSPPVVMLSLDATAVLDANGDVLTTVKVVCPPGYYPPSLLLTVTVSENVKGRIVSGTGYIPFDYCTGTTQTDHVLVFPSQSQQVFRRGVAFGRAEYGFCDSTGCADAVDQHDVQIVKN